MVSFLADRLSTQSVGGAISAIHTVRRLADKYYSFGFRHWDEVKEHEIRTFLIMPLLLALGWREEQIKLELNLGRLGTRNIKSIDVACFSEEYQPGDEEAYRENSRLVIESKRFSSGVADAALEQAEGYAKPLPNCNLIVVTNGYCYKAFERSAEIWIPIGCSHLPSSSPLRSSGRQVRGSQKKGETRRLTFPGRR